MKEELLDRWEYEDAVTEGSACFSKSVSRPFKLVC
jgi:hypothetical protein